MKSTLKRKLVVRKTVEREAHGISNALLRFRQFSLVTGIVGIPIDCLLVNTVAFLSSVPQQLFELSDKSRKKIAGFGSCYSLWCANFNPTEESWHMLFCAGLSLPSFSWPWWTHTLHLNWGMLLRGRVDTLCQSSWQSYDFMQPILKHRPRCLTSVRVLGWWQTRKHNENKGYLQLKWDLLLMGSASLIDLFYC